MKFSVLIANYNNEKFFTDCYHSLINQTYQNFEVIIVDDCSTDDSLDLIESLIFGNARFKLHKNESNFGVGYTKKKCADIATGEICGFLDPDDALSKDAIEIMVNAHQKHKNIVGFYSQFFMCDQFLSVKNIFPKTKQVVNNDMCFVNLENIVSHFFTYKNNAYKNVNLDPLLIKAVDQDLYLNIYEQGRLKFIKKPLYYYRNHDKGISQKKGEKGSLLEELNKVLLRTINRRGIKNINGISVEDNKDNLSKLFEYQLDIFYKIKRKMKILIQRVI